MTDYEMKQENLNDLFICKYCNQVFIEPIKLPCFNSICQSHVVLETNINEFNCNLCNQTHLIPTGGFYENTELKLLIKIQESQSEQTIHILGPNNLKAQELCEQLDSLLKKAELSSSNSIYFINEYFAGLKSSIDFEREKSHQLIEINYSRILNDLEQEKQKCLSNEEIDSGLNEAIQLSRNELIQWYKSYTNPNLNDKNEFNIFESEIKHKIRTIEYFLANFESNLLLGRDYQFEPVFGENNFGDLYLQNRSDLDSDNQKTATIYFEVDNFKSFISNKLDKYYDKWCSIDKIPWKFSCNIKENKNYELMFRVFCIPDCNEDYLKQNPFSAQISFDLFDSNEVVNMSYSDLFHYDGVDKLHGTRLCSIKNIMDPENNIYNKESDSIKILIQIQIVDMTSPLNDSI